MRAFALIASTALLSACSSMSVPDVGEGASSEWLIVPAMAGAAVLSGHVSPVSVIGAWVLMDPYAPNWNIHAAQLDERHIRFSMTHRVLHTGGAGEAYRVLKRNAQRFALEQGFSEYDIVSYEEGIESTRPFARRFAVAEVVMLRGRALPGL